MATLVTRGPTRAIAIAAQSNALDTFVIDGIRHNIPFLAALMAHERWQAGRLSTGFIAEEFPQGFHATAPEGDLAERIAAGAPPGPPSVREGKRRTSAPLARPRGAAARPPARSPRDR